MSTSKLDDASRILDAVYHEAALVEVEDGADSVDDRRWAADLDRQVQGRLAELRRGLLPASVPALKARAVPQELVVLDRQALIARLVAAAQQLGEVQYAHRHLAGLSDADLRRLVSTVEDSLGDCE